jgi:poly(3-hydroxybutyrate) depolymerase
MRGQTASGASLAEVTDFDRNPSGLRMHLYVSTTVAGRPAIVVAAHNCTGSGPAFFAATEFAALADRHGFVVYGARPLTARRLADARAGAAGRLRRLRHRRAP